jgi:hypothetical protein
MIWQFKTVDSKYMNWNRPNIPKTVLSLNFDLLFNFYEFTTNPKGNDLLTY